MDNSYEVRYCYGDFLRAKKLTLVRVAFAYVENVDSIDYAFAINHPNDQFDKRVGRKIAYTRLLTHLQNPNKFVKCGGYSVKIDREVNLYDIKQMIIEDFMSKTEMTCGLY